ncbi:MAG: response regulator, partial [Planctomycetota bacterium]
MREDAGLQPATTAINSVTLHSANPPSRPRDHAADPAGHARPRDVLLVEDLETDSMLVARLLRRTIPDLTFRHATSINDAIRELHERLPDVVLLDNQLPDGSASDLLAAMTSDEFTGVLPPPRVGGNRVPVCPVVVLTGGGHETLVVQLLRDGAGDYVPKQSLELGQKRTADEAAATLMRAVTHARERHRLARRAALLRQSARKKRRDLRQFARDAEAARLHLDLSLRAADLGVWEWSSASNTFGYDDRVAGLIGGERLSLPDRVHRDDRRVFDDALEALRTPRNFDDKADHFLVEVRLRTAENTWR